MADSDPIDDMPSDEAPPLRGTILVTGATGYVGGRLAPRLLERGYHVRVLTRDAAKLRPRSWADHPKLTVVEGDASDEDALDRACSGCHAAYYLVHSMRVAGDDYASHDRHLAKQFAQAASRNGVERILYLGGLGEMGEDLSEHLVSRREVEYMLASTGVPLTTLRAAMIIGSGSASFEILRYIVDRLPIMITPSWVRTESQPIAIRDVLHYLIAALETPATTGRAIDIAGPDVLTYRELMRLTARELGIRDRIVIPVPVLTPGLSARWLGLITPVPTSIARPLTLGLRNRVVARDSLAKELMPHRCLTAREAIHRAVRKSRDAEIETIWSAAGIVPGDPEWAGGTLFRDERTTDVDANAEHAFEAICRLGGGHGWYAVNWLWRLRGMLDKLAGGPGLRRGRRDPAELHYGDALDFWRVIRIEPPRRLTLLAEMIVPGQAQLEFTIEPDERVERNAQDGLNRCVVRMEARFQPRGLLGLLYWYTVLPAHNFVFSGMLAGIKRTAEQIAHDRRDARTREAA